MSIEDCIEKFKEEISLEKIEQLKEEGIIPTSDDYILVSMDDIEE